MNSQDVDLVCIGAGPAGLATAIKTKESGVDRVTIIERAESLGGLLHQCIHNGFGLKYFKEDLTGPEYAQRFIEKVKDLNINLQLETMVLSISPGPRLVTCSRNGLVKLNAKAVVLAMGCRERTREALMIPGTRPAGILTAGTAQRYVNVEGYVPGRRIVILGSGDVGMIMARRLTLEGAQVKAVVEKLPYVGGSIRNEVQCVHDFDIPLLLKHTVVEVKGQPRIEGVVVTELDKKSEPIAGTERLLSCDTLLISAGLIPENELSRMTGCIIDMVTGGPVVNERMETNVPGIFAGGNVVHVHDLVDNVTLESELAGINAAKYVLNGRNTKRCQIRLKAGRNIKYVVPHYISGEKEVTLYARVIEPKERVVIRIGSIAARPFRKVSPSEMLTIKLTVRELARIGEGISKLVISCEGRN